MTMLNIKRNLLLILLCVVTVSFISCKKEEVPTPLNPIDNIVNDTDTIVNDTDTIVNEVDSNVVVEEQCNMAQSFSYVRQISTDRFDITTDSDISGNVTNTGYEFSGANGKFTIDYIEFYSEIDGMDFDTDNVDSLSLSFNFVYLGTSVDNIKNYSVEVEYVDGTTEVLNGDISSTSKSDYNTYVVGLVIAKEVSDFKLIIETENTYQLEFNTITLTAFKCS